MEKHRRCQADGKYKGRALTARAKAEEVWRLDAEGISLSDIARRLSTGKALVHQILNVC
jgi:hypothetical protein